MALSKVIINVTEDHGGSKGQTSNSSTISLQPEQLLSSLATHNLPPLLKNLVLSLQTVSTKSNDSGSQGLSSISPRGSSQDADKEPHSLPEDLLQMANAFRHVRNTIAPPELSDAKMDDLNCDSDLKEQDSFEDNLAKECHGNGERQPQVTEAMLEERMFRLEKQLESYIDAKFVKLEHEINSKFEEIVSRLPTTHQINDTALIKTSVLVADDHQLD